MRKGLKVLLASERDSSRFCLSAHFSISMFQGHFYHSRAFDRQCHAVLTLTLLEWHMQQKIEIEKWTKNVHV